MKTVDLANITAGIAATGATVPDDVAALVAHARELSRNPDAADPAGIEATALLPLIGDRAAFDKALTKAATRAATARAELDIRRQLSTRAANTAMSIIRERRNDIGALVAEAVSAHTDTLNENAAKVPAYLNPDDPSDLTPDQYTAFRACQAAAGPLEVAARDLGSLYINKTGGMVTLAVTRRLIYIDVPDTFDGLDHAGDVAEALAGTGRTGVFSPANHLPRYYPATAAAAGLTFKWATPAEHAARVNRLLAGITPSTWAAEPKASKPTLEAAAGY